MTGISPDGAAVSYSRRGPTRLTPPGPLTQQQVIELQGLLARGLSGQGYTAEQIGQVLGRSLRTVRRRTAVAG